MCKCVWCQDLEGAENLSTVKGIMGADLFGERERELEDRKERRKKKNINKKQLFPVQQKRKAIINS